MIDDLLLSENFINSIFLCFNIDQIVNNKFCAIDVDKWDYIVRDSYYLRNAIDLPLEFDRFFEGQLFLETSIFLQCHYLVFLLS